MPILNLKYIKSDSVKEKNIQLVYENYINLSTLEQKIVLFYILEAIKDFDHIGYYEIGNSVVSLNQAAGLGKNPSTSIEDFKAISLAVIHLSLDNVEIYSEY
ncbi:hypothetical protein RAK27_00360 [Carnobacterium maltaromaticum]|uniref:Uncharacterized protein n=1 Tax=Carnobacterium maltaromaticum TaxID=2751 RepID=A0AAW9JP45_CARML|nr:hypothetical protein [Carnobacterium maltaromaticum]MDZ5757104.1 hypothetical protein [Carnobacterium maltaromaticum]